MASRFEQIEEIILKISQKKQEEESKRKKVREKTCCQKTVIFFQHTGHLFLTRFFYYVKRSSASLSLLFAILQKSFEISLPMNFLSNFFATTAVVPVPINGS